MKKTIISIILSLITMIAIPFATIFFTGSNDGIGIFLLLIAVLNPIVSIIIGIISGGEKVHWYLPVINAVIYIAAYGVVMMFDATLILSAVAYAGLGLAAAYITKIIKAKKAK